MLMKRLKNILVGRLILVLLLALCAVGASAAKKETITGEYTYYAPENVTQEQAKETARIKAIVQGLSDRYGMLIGQDVTTVLENINGQSSANVFQQTMSSIKGEWLRDVGEPKYDISYQDGQLIVSVKVKFEARERKTSSVDFDYKVLRNGTTDGHEATDFKSGNDMYLSFIAPKDGYLAVYLVEGEVAYCLLPYREQTMDASFKVKGNRRYVFFSAEADKSPYVDEYVLTTDKDIENDVLYVIYSPNEFSKPVDVQSGRQVIFEGTDGLPRELEFKKFQKWLSNLKLHDEQLNDQSKTITMKK